MLLWQGLGLAAIAQTDGCSTCGANVSQHELFFFLLIPGLGLKQAPFLEGSPGAHNLAASLLQGPALM